MTGLLGAMTLEEISSMPREGWANVNDPPEIRELALKMGVNIIYYALTQ